MGEQLEVGSLAATQTFVFPSIFEFLNWRGIFDLICVVPMPPRRKSDFFPIFPIFPIFNTQKYFLNIIHKYHTISSRLIAHHGIERISSILW